MKSLALGDLWIWGGILMPPCPDPAMISMTPEMLRSSPKHRLSHPCLGGTGWTMLPPSTVDCYLAGYSVHNT